jgi:hypothetical protein
MPERFAGRAYYHGQKRKEIYQPEHKPEERSGSIREGFERSCGHLETRSSEGSTSTCSRRHFALLTDAPTAYQIQVGLFITQAVIHRDRGADGMDRPRPRNVYEHRDNPESDQDACLGVSQG